MARPQAERASKAQVDLHIQRQRALGELMIGDRDKPHPVELLATGLAILALLCFG